MEFEVCRKITNLGRAGMRTLIYSVTRDAPPAELAGAGMQYGIRVEIAETGERAECRSITGDRARVDDMLDLIATGCVTPTTLDEVVYELLTRE